MVKMLTALASTISNSQVFLLKKCEKFLQIKSIIICPVVQSVVSLTSSLRVISLTVLADLI